MRQDTEAPVSARPRIGMSSSAIWPYSAAGSRQTAEVTVALDDPCLKFPDTDPLALAVSSVDGAGGQARFCEGALARPPICAFLPK